MRNGNASAPNALTLTRDHVNSSVAEGAVVKRQVALPMVEAGAGYPGQRCWLANATNYLGMEFKVPAGIVHRLR